MIQQYKDTLRPIVQAAQVPILGEFGLVVRTARHQALARSGISSAWIVQLQLEAERFAPKLLAATWESLSSSLDTIDVPWSEAVAQELQLQLDEFLADARQRLLEPIAEAAAGSLACMAPSAVEYIDKAWNLQRSAVNAKLSLYVEQRRRKAAMDMLLEVERVALSVSAHEEVLSALRQARTNVAAASGHSRLKDALDVLTSSIQTVGPAGELGVRIAAMISSFGI